jgi:hypothetical protein
VPGFARISAIVSVRRDHRRTEGAPKNAISNSNDRRELRALSRRRVPGVGRDGG